MNLPAHIAVLLVPPCTLLQVGAVTRVFAEANRHATAPLYHLRFVSADGAPVLLENNVPLAVTGSLQSVQPDEALLVLSEGIGKAESLGTALQHRAAQPLLGGLGTGAWWLAQAGLLNGYRATLHWPHLPAFNERFLKVIVTQHVFELDRDRFSCGDGVALIDGLLALISRQHGAVLTEAIASALSMERIRNQEDRQRVPLLARLGEKQPRITEAVMLMEANLEEPLTTDELARLTGQSRRQLERLFKQHLDMAPTRYYLQLRLEHARQLLRTTGKSVIQIGLLCGFSSGAHFSTVYRGHFGIAPREERFKS
ncbi:transcriptional regulator GlxA family with amidase domain [Silvimonas terrae]|uniref:Transcriptional regulator GlxA family with amidase domain n=1 Tax=Silvimonas terrae TaxID=300266 RepID=A0A840RL33_9NEIS|nr:GlxA family transcriptional regulator [Silvimonas terrae]MBB5193180.1 transcriptional regulator GlxA family with amidase domain [Silvimonas terrae]